MPLISSRLACAIACSAVACAALLTLAPGTALAGPSPADYTCWYASAQSKVYATTQAPSSAALASGGTAPTLTVAAARAEFEGRQIVLRAGDERLQDVWLQPSDLVLADGSGAQGLIPAADVTFFKVGYVKITHPSYGYKRKGLEPDPLVPMTLANGARLGWRPVSTPDLGRRAVAANATQPFYVLIDVPKDAASGTYTGSITITCADSSGAPALALTVPVSLTVYPFSVEQRTLKTAFGFEVGLAEKQSTASSRWLPFAPDPGPEALRVPETTWYAADQLRGWFGYMSDHRISSQWIGPAWLGGPASDGSASARSDVMADYLGTGAAGTFAGDQLAFNTVKLPASTTPSWVANPFASAHAKALATRYYSTALNALGDDASKAFVYPIDEPTASKRSLIEKYAALVHKAAPGSKYLLTTDATTQKNRLVKGVDIYVYRLHFIFRDDTYVKKMRAAHKEVWIYSHRTDWQSVAPGYLIDKPLTDSRVQGWFAFKARATGLLYFKIDRWRDAITGKTRDPYADPLSGFGRKGHTPIYANGDGSLTYPGYYPALGLYVEGSPPVGSLRMEALRDGLEDYEFVKLVAKRYGNSAADAFVASVIGPVPARKPSVLRFPKYAKTAGPYDQARAAMAAKLSQ